MLSAEGLSKSYGGVAALSQVSLNVGAGEVVGLIGENGAGKSTLIKIIAGLVKRDSGIVRIDDTPVNFHSPLEAFQKGIGFIHQERNILDNLDVAGNMMLGSEPRKSGFLVDRQETRRRSQIGLDKIGLKISPDQSAAGLSNAERQLVEIARALSFDSRLIIMDEPTSSLSSGETDKLLELIKTLSSSGVSIVYVSHRLEEISQIASRVVGLRDGRNAGELREGEINTKNMVNLMVGRDIVRERVSSAAIGDVRLAVRSLRTQRFPKSEVNFEVRAGEVVGVAGLVGSGRTEVVQAIFGVDKPISGEIVADGQPIKPGNPRSSIDQGVYLVPEDRRRMGAILSMSLQGNIVLPAQANFLSYGLVDRNKEKAYSTNLAQQLKVKAASLDLDVSSLSGGNQQKIVLAKWLGMNPKCLILDEPTVGIDVGARAEIYRLIRELAAKGVAILMVSSDLEEVLQLSDRILVMHDGKLMGELEGNSADEAKVMNLAVGNA